MVNKNMYNQTRINENFSLESYLAQREKIKEEKKKQHLAESEDSLTLLQQINQEAKTTLSELQHIVTKLQAISVMDEPELADFGNVGLFEVHARRAYTELSEIGKLITRYENSVENNS